MPTTSKFTSSAYISSLNCRLVQPSVSSTALPGFSRGISNLIRPKQSFSSSLKIISKVYTPQLMSTPFFQFFRLIALEPSWTSFSHTLDLVNQQMELNFQTIRQFLTTSTANTLVQSTIIFYLGNASAFHLVSLLAALAPSVCSQHSSQ